MQLKRLNRKDKLVKKVKDLYLTAFPRDEQMPFSRLLGMMNEKYRLYALLDEDDFIGFLYLYHSKDTFLYYLAVAEEYRGRGYGTEALQLIRNLEGTDNIILDIEEVKSCFTEKRRNFYLNAGFHTTDIRYHFFGVDYEIISLQEGYTKEEYARLAKEIWGAFSCLIRYH